MNKCCPNCGLDLSHEPGFYIGAMYVSYAQGIAVAVATGIISQFLFHATFNQTLLLIAMLLAVTAPVNFRLSRLVWINIWVSYDANVVSQKESEVAA